MTARDIAPVPGDSLRFVRLAIDRLEGIDAPFALEEFADGINLVVGPNASGKSRMSIALQALLWPGTAPLGSDLVGRFTVTGSAWDVRVAEKNVRYWQGGAPSDGPSLGSVSALQKDRYLLTLHDLLRADNGDLAKEIQVESQGGYDLNRARMALDFPRSAPKPVARAHVKAVRDARGVLAKLRSDDSILRTREEQLSTLERKIRDALAARARVSLLERALQHFEHREERDRRRTARDQFPDPIDRMTGAEPATVAELRAQREALSLKRRDAEQAVAQARADLEITGFESGRPGPETLAELRDRARRLREFEADDVTERGKIAVLRLQRDRARSRLGDALTDNQLANLELDGLHELVGATRKAIEAESAFTAQRAMYEWVGSVRQPDNLSTLQQGVATLSQRLQVVGEDSAQPPHGLVQLMLIVAAVVIVIEAVLLGLDVSPIWYVLALLALPVLWIAYRPQEPAGAAIAQAAERDYSVLGLEVPASWTDGDVRHRLASLRAEVDAEKVTRWQDLAGSRADAEIATKDAEAARDAVQRSLGVDDVGGDWTQVERLASALESWRVAGDELARAETRQEGSGGQRAILLDGISTTLIDFGVEPIVDATALDHRITALESRITVARDAQNRLEGQLAIIDQQLQPQIDDVDSRIAQVYSSLGLDVNNDVALRALSERVVDCREATDSLRDAEMTVAMIARELASNPELLDWRRTDLDADLEAARERSDAYDQLRDARATILSEVEQAKRDTRLEIAVETEVQALATLDGARKGKYTEAAQWKLWNFLHHRTRDLNRPAVFRTAQDFFTRFTSGAFELQFSDELPTAKFQARETSTGASLELDQLSSGTRVQLLMAVRIAFIEEMEHGYRLPLLLDETLGNTDDIRINAIIDATIELSRKGRQVIYFTAQREELAKWRARLDQAADVNARVFDLAEIRQIAAAGRPVELAWKPESPSMRILPANLDHVGARDYFLVPPIDPWARTLDAAHVWYFFPSVPVLVQLDEFGVKAWGQYKTLRKRTLTPLIKELATEHERAERRHRVLAAALEFWCVGRCMPIDLHVVTSFGKLTGSTREPVFAMCEEVGWDGARLIALLRERRISHFNERRIVELEAHLRDHNRIADGEPYPNRVVRAHALAAADGELTSDEVDGLLAAIGLQGSD